MEWIPTILMQATKGYHGRKSRNATKEIFFSPRRHAAGIREKFFPIMKSLSGSFL